MKIKIKNKIKNRKEVIRMTDTILERNLRGFDYSVFSKVKDSLLEDLLQRQRMRNFRSLSQQLRAEMMTEDELDYVAAAGTPSIEADKNKK